MHDAEPVGSSLWSDLAAALFLLGLGGVAVWQGASIPVTPLFGQVGPTAVPYAVGGLLLLVGGGLSYQALRGGWSHALDAAEDVPPTNWRTLTLVLAGLLANAALIGPFGFTVAASVQFVLVAAGFGSRLWWRDALLAPPFALLIWFGFVRVLGVNIGAGVVEELVLGALGMDAGA